MSKINIFRYRPKHMEKDLFYNIANDLRFKGEFVQGEEGMVIYNDEQVMTWSQPNAKFGGVLFYTDRNRSLAKPAKRLAEVESVREYMNGFLKRSQLMPDSGKHEVSVKLKAKVTDAMIETGEKEEVKRVPMRVDVYSDIRLDDVPVMGPRAKIRAAFDGETPQFLHIGLWETVDVYKTGELIPKDHLLKIIDEKARNRKGKINLQVQDIYLAFWAREYCGGADILEPYYFVEVEHLASDKRKREEGAGPKQVLRFLAYT